MSKTAWLVERPGPMWLFLDGIHWGWTGDANRATHLDDESKGDAFLRMAKDCGVDWPNMSVTEHEFVGPK